VQLDPLVPVRVGERFPNLRPQLRIKCRHACANLDVCNPNRGQVLEDAR
jgi:hypothetical protein